MSHDFRDRDGGHQVNPLSNGGWTPHYRKFAKRMTRREMRREHRKVVQSALLDYEQELEERREWEESQYIALLDGMYEDDWRDFEMSEDEIEDRFAEDSYQDDFRFYDDDHIYFEDEPSYYNDDYHDIYYIEDYPPRCEHCGAVIRNP